MIKRLLPLFLLFRPISALRHNSGGIRYFSQFRSILPTRRHMSTDTKQLPCSEQEWKTKLTPNQYEVLRNKATEPPGYSERTPGELEHELKSKFKTKYPKEGIYECVGCGAALYQANTKFDSGCGWPAFYEGISNAIHEVKDADGQRVEILCNRCKSHLGHVFKGEGFPTPTNERHCVNGICLKYKNSNEK